ncbi:hypothetical protein [Cellulophaga sp. L1A9]|uniref:hypothetical protein n=1 Tax=Cellulophaga sp. L1A9 TaxID=2686362 RepID=UPI00131ADB75|nr:hypothetical protein [Cellulophaga sp. L1A9]
MQIKLIIYISLVSFLGCNGQKKEKNVVNNTGEFNIEIVKYKKNRKLGYAEKSVFKILENKKYIDSIEIIIPYSDCNNNETLCGIDYLNGSFEISDINNDSFAEIQFAYQYYAKSEELAKNLKVIFYDTKTKVNYFADGIGVNHFDQVLDKNSKGRIIEISNNIPDKFIKELEKKWHRYSFEDKLPINSLNSKIKITEIEEGKITNEKSNSVDFDKISTTSIKEIRLNGNDGEFINLITVNGLDFKFKNPAIQTDHHKIKLIDNKIIKLTNSDSKNSYVVTYWYLDENKKTLILFKSEAQSYDYGKITKYRLENINYDIKEIDSDKFYDEVYDSNNEI